MRRRTKSEQRAYARERAPELARTWQVHRVVSNRVDLRFEENCPEARTAVDDERIRENLDRLCQEARAHA
jgi:hypothetical protein